MNIKVKKMYSKWIALSSLVLVVILLSSLYLPMLYRRVFFGNMEKTKLFYSPVSNEFVFTEGLLKKLPGDAQEKFQDHNPKIVYKKVDGTYLSRRQFEQLLPFYYHEQMEQEGAFPLDIQGQIFDLETIKKYHQLIELNVKQIPGHSPGISVFPLTESIPGQKELIFSKEQFRMTRNSMEFINTASNKKDEKLTRLFTSALGENGFLFPARAVYANSASPKSLHGGVFLVDQEYHVFYVKRVEGIPQVMKTSIDPGIRTRAIGVSPSDFPEYHGVLVAEDGRIFLISRHHFELIALPCEGYSPDTMDLTLILNPLYCTAVFSDDQFIHAVAMDRNFQVVDTHSRKMSRAILTPARACYKILFPFIIQSDDPASGFLSVNFIFQGWFGAMGIALWFFMYGFWCFFVIRKPPTPAKTALVAMFGIYGLVVLNLVDIKV